MSSTTTQATTLPAACQARADLVRRLASSNGITPRATTRTVIAYRLGWDAYAAGEYPRPMLQDAADLSTFAPELADIGWHHAAGATILGAYCCGTPAAHRDALADLAREIRNG